MSVLFFLHCFFAENVPVCSRTRENYDILKPNAIRFCLYSDILNDWFSHITCTFKISDPHFTSIDTINELRIICLCEFIKWRPTWGTDLNQKRRMAEKLARTHAKRRGNRGVLNDLDKVVYWTTTFDDTRQCGFRKRATHPCAGELNQCGKQ